MSGERGSIRVQFTGKGQGFMSDSSASFAPYTFAAAAAWWPTVLAQ
ncbi:MAG TPA: hypothetical protein VJS42_14055 [Steroidobacteraceae bacterium]|nr:hypothetical protein [Steroidobacteraceae bacterium]